MRRGNDIKVYASRWVNLRINKKKQGNEQAIKIIKLLIAKR